jgi:hypothetical protein
MVDGGPEQGHQGLHMEDRQDDSLLVGAAPRIVQAIQQLPHRLTLHGGCGVVEPELFFTVPVSTFENLCAMHLLPFLQ